MRRGRAVGTAIGGTVVALSVLTASKAGTVRDRRGLKGELGTG